MISINSDCRLRMVFSVLLVATVQLSNASNWDVTGVSLVRQFDPTLRGAGIRVAQVEAPADNSSPPSFEVNPSAVNQPADLFTYFSSSAINQSGFPNSAGTESGHADAVANNFFGASSGVVPQISHVDNYEAGYFYNNLIASPAQPSIPARIINQSFIFNQDSVIEQDYDDYAVRRNNLFVSGAGLNGTQVHPAASCYNGLGVGVSDVVNPPFGPTLDGRCKPDIIAPGVVASYATPYVSGSAALILQAATRGDGGTNLHAATNFLTLKTLLLNGAIKPAGWTNSPASPLDHAKGAGVVNAFNSWIQLKGGKHSPIERTSVSADSAHPPGANLSNMPVSVGWDFAGITNSNPDSDTINHYYFDLPGSNVYTLTATLVWNRHQGQNNINNLDLFLYNIANSDVVASSISTKDNVEHLSLPQLPPGRYDLQVLKHGSMNQVSDNETYALAFEFFSMKLNIAKTNSNSVIIQWPVAPTGFTLESTGDLNPPAAWFPVNITASVDTNSIQNVAIIPMTSSNQFFRLRRP